MRTMAWVTMGTLLALAGGSAAQAPFHFVMFLHEEPLHIAPDTLLYDKGAKLSILVGNPANNTSPHNVHFEGYNLATPMLAPGRAAYLNFTLDKVGTFSYYCTVPGHSDGGQIGTLTVEGPAPEKRGMPATAAGLAALVMAGAAWGARRR